MGFLELWRQCGVSHEIGRGAQGDSCGATEVRSPWTWRGGAPHCSRVMVPKFWSFSICPSNEYSGLISFRFDWLDLLAVQGTL